ncbi:MAG TPA: DUF4258 domain-containing protein [Candidatus Nanoarchaeia archaeon]|nr:DUF4258 domain-containing protein [Candidatus Nanoarchaeia archaeon]
MRIVFTTHAITQMKERGISEDEIIQTIMYPETTLKIDTVYYVQKKILQGTIEVVYIRENYIKVITVYPL